MALVRGESGARQWLIYAHSPLENRGNVEITLPDFGQLTIDVPRAGTFHIVDERNRKITPLDVR